LSDYYTLFLLKNQPKMYGRKMEMDCMAYFFVFRHHSPDIIKNKCHKCRLSC
jgi:hypothetical protein